MDSWIANRRNNGFTMVELAVVLVIIGLLVASILTGYILIQTAMDRKLMRDVEEINTALMAFRLKYGALPGDFSQATDIWGLAGFGTGQTTNGDGNGVISICSNEQGRLFEQLSLAGMIKGEYDWDVPVRAIGVSYPKAAFEQFGYRVMADSYGGDFAFYANKNMLNVGAGTNCIDDAAAIYTPRRMWAMDVKYDDGEAEKGKIWNWGATCVDWGAAATFPYLIDNDSTLECGLSYVLIAN